MLTREAIKEEAKACISSIYGSDESTKVNYYKKAIIKALDLCAESYVGKSVGISNQYAISSAKSGFIHLDITNIYDLIHTTNALKDGYLTHINECLVALSIVTPSEIGTDSCLYGENLALRSFYSDALSGDSATEEVITTFDGQ